jgi:hypothetical protein
VRTVAARSDALQLVAAEIFGYQDVAYVLPRRVDSEGDPEHDDCLGRKGVDAFLHGLYGAGTSKTERTAWLSTLVTFTVRPL